MSAVLVSNENNKAIFTVEIGSEKFEEGEDYLYVPAEQMSLIYLPQFCAATCAVLTLLL